MHELGYATELVATLEELMVKEKLTEITEVTLTCGEATGIIPKYMYDCWPAAIEGTKLETCVLKVETVPAWGRCRDCEERYVVSLTHGRCPKCGSEDYDMETGYEFEVTEIRGR